MLGIELVVGLPAEEVRAAIDQAREAELIMIDTAGFNPYEPISSQTMERAINGLSPMEVPIWFLLPQGRACRTLWSPPVSAVNVPIYCVYCSREKKDAMRPQGTAEFLKRRIDPACHCLIGEPANTCRMTSCRRMSIV